jgi:hypothetical protein
MPLGSNKLSKTFIKIISEESIPMTTIRIMFSVAVVLAFICYVSATASAQNCADGLRQSGTGISSGRDAAGCNAEGCNGGCSKCSSGRCPRVQCPSCEKYCKVESEIVKEKKYGWDVECKPICIPKVTFPWQKCCEPKCAKMKYVRVLKKEEYECEHCQYKFTPVCNEDCQVPYTHCQGLSHVGGLTGGHACGCGAGCGVGMGCRAGRCATGAGCASDPIIYAAPQVSQPVVVE